MSISLPRSREMERSKSNTGPFLVGSLLLVTNLLLLLSPVKAGGVCTSKGGKFLPYTSEGKPPRRASKGPKDLTLCRVFRKRTCCDVAQTHAALVTIRRLASTGDATEECLQLWELLECSICDPRVGVQPGLPLVCASFCDRVFQACSSAYFSMDTMSQVLAPCGTTEIICARASKWVSNGTDLCQAAGFSVKEPEYLGEEETSCYGGKASFDIIADSWKSGDTPGKPAKEAVIEDFVQQMKEMPLTQKVFWAVGGLVLTAGLLVISKRKSHSQRKKLAAIQNAARKMEVQKSGSSAKWKGKGRRLSD